MADGNRAGHVDRVGVELAERALMSPVTTMRPVIVTKK